ncbi:HAD hydrolase-like protein [Phenylobacterium sp. LjRoot225]|uniref:HAD hydrolase-like protein n=1 Tax=Phenylobacterium sp. LjRoot225 TaxID=3342285 RepID=UPI003ECC96DB
MQKLIAGQRLAIMTAGMPGAHSGHCVCVVLGRDMAVRKRSTLLLDLDGTLVDPAPGIIGSCQYALEELGAPVPDDADLRWVIGPPLRASFSKLLGEHGDPEAALQLYRKRYSASGLYDAAPYPRILAVLESKVQSGTRLILCTAKPKLFAQRVVDHFGFSPLLSGVYGPELDGRFDDKGDLIEHLLEREALSPDQVCMVGDREHDVRAAMRHGIPTVGVLWGYGTEAELAAAGAALTIREPCELLQ